MRSRIIGKGGSVVQLAPSTRGAALQSRMYFILFGKVLMFFVYILQSQKDKSYYIGYSKDVASRLVQHNTGKSTYTKRKIPWNLVYTEKFELKSDAIKREKFLKAQRNTEFYKKLTNSWIGSSVG